MRDNAMASLRSHDDVTFLGVDACDLSLLRVIARGLNGVGSARFEPDRVTALRLRAAPRPAKSTDLSATA
jgi:hypothetical protein